MGSFNMTCALSGLSIRREDPVRYLLLTQNKNRTNKDHQACYVTDWWFPRNFPLRAQYNDYGTVEEVEEGLQRELWMEAFKEDLVERGWGDNSSRDMPTLKNMTFATLLEVVREGRVKVKREPWRKSEPVKKEPLFPEGCEPKVRLLEILQALEGDRALLVGEEIHWLETHKEYDKDPGVPSIAIMTQKLQGAGHVVRDVHTDGILVDTPEINVGRIRLNGYDSWEIALKELQIIEPLFSADFATIITPGSGSYAKSVELRLYPKPGTPKIGSVGNRGWTRIESDRLQISHALILDKVWQGLVDLKIQDLISFKEGVASLYEEFQAFERQKQEAKGSENPFTSMRFKEKIEMSQNPIARVLYSRNGALPFSMRLRDHWEIFCKKPLSPEEAEPFLQTVAETCLIESAMEDLGIMWKPSTCMGPYWPEYELQIQFHDLCASTMKAKKAEEAGEEDEVDEDEVDEVEEEPNVS